MKSSGSPNRMFGWYYGWNVVTASLLAMIASTGLTINSITLFLQPWSHDLHSSISHILVAILPMAAMTAISSMLTGPLADKRPARWLFAAGLTGVALFSLLISLVTEVWQIWVLYGTLLPVSVALSSVVTSNALVSRWFVRRLGLALGITSIGVSLGGIVLPPIVSAALPAIGWRGVWRAAALIIALVAVPLVLAVIRDAPDERDGDHYLNPETEARVGSGNHHLGPAHALSLRDIFMRRNFWLLVMWYLPLMALAASVLQNLAPIAASRGFDTNAASMLVSLFSMTGVVATVAAGVISDRYGNRLPSAILGVLVAVGGLTAAYGHSLPALVLAAALIGLSTGMWTLLPGAAAVEFGAGGLGRAFGALMLFLPINAVAPLLVARARETTGTYAVALMVLSLIVLAGSALVLLIRERRGGTSIGVVGPNSSAAAGLGG